jgi:prevent-host-death family protein
MRYSTSDLSRKSGDIIARALQGPITITQRGKPRLIMMSVEEFNRLTKKRDEGRKPAPAEES